MKNSSLRLKQLTDALKELHNVSKNKREIEQELINTKKEKEAIENELAALRKLLEDTKK